MSDKKRKSAALEIRVEERLEEVREMQNGLEAKAEAGGQLLKLLESPVHQQCVTVGEELNVGRDYPSDFCEAVDKVIMEHSAPFCVWVREWCKDIAVEDIGPPVWTERLHKIVFLLWRHMQSTIGLGVLTRAINNGINYSYDTEQHIVLIRALLDELAIDPFMKAHPSPHAVVDAED